ncbi:MAG: cardiolipin synthase B [Gammaproteobacteria bacterium]|nr:cardiolipin synthase B [Gammaproteobacteria bacterium]
MQIWTWLVGLVIGIAVVYTLLYFLGRRRRTPDWKWDQDAVPTITDLAATLSGLTRSPVYDGNSAEVFTNGAIFDPIFSDLEQAQHTINLETFVWWGGRLERRLADALLAACRRGVKVRVTADGVGAMKRSSGIFEELRAAGVRVEIYCPVRPWTLHRFNERTHRKLLIIDGRIGYTMGHGVADEWLGDAHSEDHFRDTGLRLQGPVVHGLQTVFAENWTQLTDELLVGDTVFPPLEESGNSVALVISSSSGDDFSNVEIGFAMALAAAREEILIQNPYFAPDRNVVRLMCETAARGVSIRLMVPGEAIDAQVLRRAARHLYPTLIEAGVEVMEYRPTLSHQKVMVIDGTWSRIGSTNLDCRSLELNEEAGVFICDTGIAATLRQQFIADTRHCTKINAEQCEQLGFTTRMFDAGAYLIHGQL